jgi:hypothetical protein
LRASSSKDKCKHTDYGIKSSSPRSRTCLSCKLSMDGEILKSQTKEQNLPEQFLKHTSHSSTLMGKKSKITNASHDKENTRELSRQYKRARQTFKTGQQKLIKVPRASSRSNRSPTGSQSSHLALRNGDASSTKKSALKTAIENKPKKLKIADLVQPGSFGGEKQPLNEKRLSSRTQK